MTRSQTSIYPRQGLLHWNLFTICLIFLVLTACQTKLDNKDIRWVPGLGGERLSNISHVNGIRQALSESKTPVRVLVVHGMITNDPHYSQAFQAAIGKKLELVRGRQYPVMSLERGYQFSVISASGFIGVSAKMSEIRKTSWLDSSNKERLVFYELLWAPWRDDIKRQFLACYESRLTEDCHSVTGVNWAKDSHTLFNGWIKDDILVNGFADAMLVLSPLGDVIRDDIHQAQCVIATDALVESGFPAPHRARRCNLLDFAANPESVVRAESALSFTKLITVTHSLGSFLVLDAIQQYEKKSSQAQDSSPVEIANSQSEFLLSLLTNGSSVFMMANQIGLLQLARLEAVCEPKADGEQCPNRLLPGMDKVLAGKTFGQLGRFVAFTDSNDPLSL